MIYTLRPRYNATLHDVAIRLCDIFSGRAFSPVVKNTLNGKVTAWDIDGTNNRIIRHKPDDPLAFELSCRSALDDATITFLQREFHVGGDAPKKERWGRVATPLWDPPKPPPEPEAWELDTEHPDQI